MGQEVCSKGKESQALEVVRKEEGKRYSNEDLEHDVYLKDLEGQGVEIAGKASGKLYAESKQEKLPTLMEKNQQSPGTDEDSTWKAMKRASRRNLDGDVSEMKQAGQPRQPVSTPTSQIELPQPGYREADKHVSSKDEKKLHFIPVHRFVLEQTSDYAGLKTKLVINCLCAQKIESSLE